VINEPTAAAVSFGVEHDFNGTVLVYDLGGGTFDVTLLAIQDGKFDILRTDGDKNLGGFDFDNAIIEWIKAEFAERTGAVVDDDAQLRDRAEQAKHRLSQAERAPIFVSAAGRNERLILERGTFEQIVESLLAKTEMLVEEVVEDAGLSFAAIDKVLLVGGSTRMPMVPAMLTRLTGRAPDQSVHPDEAVAKGAAIVAGLRGDGAPQPAPTPVTPSGHTLAIDDVVSHGLGVVIVDDRGREINSVIFPANTKIPDRKSELYSTTSENQTALHVQVTEGDEEDLRYVRKLGDSTLRIPQYPRGAPIEVVFSCDIDGILHIEVIDRIADESLGEFEIDRASNLDQGEIDRMREAVDRLEIE